MYNVYAHYTIIAWYYVILLKTKLSKIYIAIIITKIKRPLKPCKFLKGCSTR